MKFLSLKNVLLTLFLSVLICNSCTKEEQIIVESHTNDDEFDISLELASSLAQEIAQRNGLVNLSNNVTLKSGELDQKEINDVLTYSDEKGIPLLYVVSYDPEGFAIIPATKKEVPLLAYSENSSFNADNLNNGVLIWLNSKKEKIKKLKEDTTSTIDDNVALQWEIMSSSSSEVVKTAIGKITDELAEPMLTTRSLPLEDDPEIGEITYEKVEALLTTQWGQDYHYNDSCPDYNCTNTLNGRAKAGCVAIAQAQVMKYYEYPSSYNFDAMYNTSATTETARLIHDVGVSVNMDYGCSSSGAYTSSCVSSLLNTFGYSFSSTNSYVDYTEAAVIAQLDNNWPVITQGYDDSVGRHTWVCDGYRRYKTEIIHYPGTIYEYTSYEYTSAWLHMNWGWYGDYDGWFQTDDFTPGSNNYYNCKIIQGIHP